MSPKSLAQATEHLGSVLIARDKVDILAYSLDRKNNSRRWLLIGADTACRL